jgi:hypothetical protein
VQTEMDSDKLELAAIDKECALLQVILNLKTISLHHGTSGKVGSYTE